MQIKFIIIFNEYLWGKKRGEFKGVILDAWMIKILSLPKFCPMDGIGLHRLQGIHGRECLS